MTQIMIKTELVKKSFGQNIQALNGVSLEVEEGAVVVLLGPSGSGKSTFLRTLNFLEEIDEGKIIIDGIDFSTNQLDVNLLRTNVGMVFQL